jgi:hypothetical protein
LGGSCQGGAGLDVELGEHVGEVALDGPGGDEQGLGDLAVGEPFGVSPGSANVMFPTVVMPPAIAASDPVQKSSTQTGSCWPSSPASAA